MKSVDQRDALLEEIKELLFPPLLTRTTEDGTKYHVDKSVDMNLDAAIADVVDGYLDDVTTSTLNEIAKKLSKLRKLLKVNCEIDPEVESIFFEMQSNDSGLDSIKASE